MNFLELLQESAPSGAGYMDTKEIMRLYYGRLGMFVSFSDDEKLDMSGFDGSELNRPYAIKSYTVDTLIGRKVHSAKFYAHVFRIKSKSKKFIEDIRNYTKEDFETDFEVLTLLGYIDQEELHTSRLILDSSNKVRYEFDRLWQLTKMITKSEGKYADKLWRRVLLDLGYGGFSDYSGLGIMAKGRQSITIILEEGDIEVYDIVPIQKYRKDKRQRVIDQVNRKNKLSHARRNRVAKVKTNPTREDGTGGFLTMIKDFLR